MKEAPSKQRRSRVSARLAGRALLSLGVLLVCVATFIFVACYSVSDGFTYRMINFEVGDIETIFEWDDFYRITGIAGAIGLAGLGLFALGARVLRPSVPTQPHD